MVLLVGLEVARPICRDALVVLRQATALGPARHVGHYALVVISPSESSGCRLFVDADEAVLDGTPEALRLLATWLRSPDLTVDVELSDGGRVRGR